MLPLGVTFSGESVLYVSTVVCVRARDCGVGGHSTLTYAVKYGGPGVRLMWRRVGYHCLFPGKLSVARAAYEARRSSTSFSFFVSPPPPSSRPHYSLPHRLPAKLMSAACLPRSKSHQPVDHHGSLGDTFRSLVPLSPSGLVFATGTLASASLVVLSGASIAAAGPARRRHRSGAPRGCSWPPPTRCGSRVAQPPVLPPPFDIGGRCLRTSGRRAPRR